MTRLSESISRTGAACLLVTCLMAGSALAIDIRTLDGIWALKGKEQERYIEFAASEMTKTTGRDRDTIRKTLARQMCGLHLEIALKADRSARMIKESARVPTVESNGTWKEASGQVVLISWNDGTITYLYQDGENLSYVETITDTFSRSSQNTFNLTKISRMTSNVSRNIFSQITKQLTCW